MTADKKAAFIARFGGIYEHSPWVARKVWFSGVEALPLSKLGDLMASAVAGAGATQKLALIRAHPDLAERAGVGEPLTQASAEEQASAGIDQCSAAEFEQFQQLNYAYKARFSFPFVMAVRGSSRHDILAAFAHRLNHERDAELATAMAEIHKIARLRLEALSNA